VGVLTTDFVIAAYFALPAARTAR